jgi:preprotein translocase subunit SecG
MILNVFLTLVLVINALFLILLVLIQLPKKEAGAGLAFGAGTADALLGAGSGNALTKLTKYAATMFMGLCLLLGVMNSKAARSSTSDLNKALEAQRKAAAVVTPPAGVPVQPTNQFQLLNTNALAINTNAVAAPATNATAVRAVTNAPAAPTNAAPK